jgi:hypothetical protein
VNVVIGSLRARLLTATTASALSVSVFVIACANSGADIPTDAREAGTVEASTTRLPDGGDPNNVDDDSGSNNNKDGGGNGDAGPDGGGPNNAVVIISEIYVDNDGLGDGSEFIEIQGAPNTPVDDLRVRLIDKNGLPKYTQMVGDPGDKIGTSGFWVVSGSQVFKLNASPYREDQTYSIANWGLDNERGAVQLIRGTNQLLDVVGFASTAGAGAIPPPTNGPTSTGEANPVIIPTVAKHSFGRKPPTLSDSNNNEADFCAMVPTPGYAQKPCD